MDINFESMADLNRTVVAAFNGAMEAAPTPEHKAFSTEMRSGSASNLYPFMHSTDGMREWMGDAIFDQLASGRYAIENRKFQKGLKAQRDQIMDDQDGGAGLYGSAARVLANACASHPDELVIGECLANGETLLCHDGQPFFDDSHPNQNGDGGVQDNKIGSGGAFDWYLFDTSKPIRPLIYQIREDLTFAPATDMSSDHVMRTHEFLWNAWIRDAAGFGPWFTAIKSSATLDEAGFVAARKAMNAFHLGIKDPLTGTYRNARSRPTLLVVPSAGIEVARKLFGQEKLTSGEDNYLRNAVTVMESRYL